ncbi:MAG: hypothetical protein ACR2GY_01235 [Phycisphaerales bacterium]
MAWFLSKRIGLSATCAFAFSFFVFAQGNPLDRAGGSGDGVIANTPQARNPTTWYEGDGLKLSIERIDTNAGTIAGRLLMNGNAFTYLGNIQDEMRFAGQFDAGGGTMFDFAVELDASGDMIFKTGTSTYRLKTASSSDDRPTQQETPSAATIEGQWAGTGADTTDDGTRITFPVSIRIAKSPDGSFAATFQSTVQYPVGNGQTMPVTVTGQFTGRPSSSAILQLQSPDVTATANGEAASLGPQSLRLQLQPDQITLIGSIGSDADGWTPLTLQREGGGVDGAPQSPSTPASSQSGSAKGTVQFEKVTLRDPSLDNMESHTFLKPKGWQVQGGPVWDAMRYKDFVHMNLRVSAGDGREFSIYPGAYYQDGNGYELAIRGGTMSPEQMPRPGDAAGGFTYMPLPNSIADYVTNILMPMNRPQAQNVRVVKVTELPELKQQIEKKYAPVVQFQQQSDAQIQQGGGRTQTQWNFIAEKVHIAYQENGQAFEEEVWVTGTVMQRNVDLMSDGFVMYTVDWQISDPRGVRAPAGQLDQARPMLETVSLSLQNNPRYSAMIMEIQNKQHAAEMESLRKQSATTMEAIKQRGEIARRDRETAWANHQAAVQEQESNQEYMNRRILNYLTDVEDFKDTDGSSVNLPGTYFHTYSDGKGNYIQSSESNFDPNRDLENDLNTTWTQIEVDTRKQGVN